VASAANDIATGRKPLGCLIIVEKLIGRLQNGSSLRGLKEARSNHAKYFVV
jgi:hypothetical protein